jgi:CheY-like chemotaxis protein
MSTPAEAVGSHVDIDRPWFSPDGGPEARMSDSHREALAAELRFGVAESPTGDAMAVPLRVTLSDAASQDGHVGGVGQLRAVDGGGHDHRPREKPATRVVVADDNDGIRLLVSTILSVEGDFSIVGEARTGVEAVAVAEAAGVDLLVLDLSMPELDGLEVLERLRSTRPELAVVVYTGLTRDGVVEQARRLGARDVVVKGVDPLVLVQRLRAAVTS